MGRILEALRNEDTRKNFQKASIMAEGGLIDMSDLDNITSYTDMMASPGESYAKDVGKGFAALPETAGALATGALAFPLSGIAGLAANLTGSGIDQSADVVRWVQENFSYQPKGETSRQQINALMMPFEKVHESASWWGDKVFEKTGNSSLSAAVASGIEAAAILGLPKSAAKLKKIRSARGMEEAWGEAKKNVEADLAKEAKRTSSKIKALVRAGKESSPEMTAALQEATRLSQEVQSLTGGEIIPHASRGIHEVRLGKADELISPDNLTKARGMSEAMGFEFDRVVSELTGKSAEKLTNREAVNVLLRMKVGKRATGAKGKSTAVAGELAEGDVHPGKMLYIGEQKALPAPVDRGIKPVGEWTSSEVGGKKFQSQTLEEGTFLRHPEGRGYKTKAAAKSVKKGLEKKGETGWEVIESEEGGYALRKKSEVKEAPKPEPTVEPTADTKQFSEVVSESVREVEPWTEGANEVFISDAFESAKRKGYEGALEDFKADLIKAHRAGEVDLIRADLVEAMPKNKVAASEANYLNADFHLIKRPKKGAETLDVSKKGDMVPETNIRYEGEGMGLHQWTDLDNGGTFATKSKNVKEVMEAQAEQASRGIAPIKKEGVVGVLEESLEQARARGDKAVVTNIEKQLEAVKTSNELKAAEVEAKGGKANKQPPPKVDPVKMGEKHGVDYVESYEYEYDAVTDPATGKTLPAETVIEHTWYDPKYNVEFTTNSLRELKRRVKEVRKEMESRIKPIQSVNELDVTLKDMVDRGESYQEVLAMSEDARAAIEAAKSRGLFDTYGDYMEAMDRLDSFQDMVRGGIKRSGEKIPERQAYKHEPVSTKERAKAEEAEKVYEQEVSEYEATLDGELEARSVKDVSRDVYDLIRSDERGSFSFNEAKLNPEQVRILKRLKNDAKRLKQDLEVYLRDYLGFDKETVASIIRAAEKIEDSKYKDLKKDIGKAQFKERKQAIDPVDGSEIIKHTRRKIRGVQIDKPPISKGEFRSAAMASDIRNKPAGGATEPMIFLFEELDRSLPKDAVKFKDMLWHPYNAAEKAFSVAWDNMKSRIKEQKKGHSFRSRRRVGTYAIAQQKKGMDILKNQGVKEVPKLNPAEMELYNWFRTEFEKFYEDINHVRVRVGKKPMKKVDNYFTFFSTMNLLDKMGKKPNLVFDSARDIKANMTSVGATPFRFAKTRKTLGLPTIELDPFTIFENYTYKGMRHIHLSPIVAKVSELRSEFKIPVKNKKGETITRRWQMSEKKPKLDEALMRWGNHIADLPSHQLPNLVERGMRTLNQNLTFSILGANLRSAAIQPSALVNAMTELGPQYLLKGLESIVDPRMRAFAMENSNVLKPRVYDAMINDALRSIKSGAIGDAKKWVGHKAMWPLKILDANTATAAWSGAYKLAKKNGMKDKAAFRYADDVVVRTQASGMAGHMSPIQRSSLGKFVSMFQTFVINDWNFLMKDVLGVRDGKYNGVNTRKLMTMMSATTLMSMFYEDVLQVSSPFPTPLRAYGEARAQGEDQLQAAVSGLFELGERVPIVGGGVRYGSHPLGAGVELVGQLTDRDAFDTNYYEMTGKWLGAPGVAQIMKSVNASKRGESTYGIVMGSYTKKGKRRGGKTKGLGGLGSLGSLGDL